MTITRRPHKRVAPRLYLLLDTGTYFVRAEGFDARGKRTARKVDLPPGTTLGQAMVARDDLLKAIAAGTFSADDAARTSPPLVADVMDLLEQRDGVRWSPSTLQQWQVARRVMDSLASMHVARVGYAAHLAPWWATVAKGRKASTLRNLRSWAVRVFRLAQSVGWATGNPAELIVVPTAVTERASLPSMESMQRAFDAWRAYDQAAVGLGEYFGWHLLYRVQLAGGFRIGELLSLRWSDIDTVDRAIHLRADVVKTRRGRSVPISDDLIAAFVDHQSCLSTSGGTMRAAQAALPDGLVWPSWNGLQRKSSEASADVWALGVRAAGLEAGREHSVTPHMLRRMAVSRMMRAGVREALVRQIVGHRNPAQLVLYDRPFEDELRTLRDAIGASVPSPASVRVTEHAYTVGGHSGDTGAPVSRNSSTSEDSDA